VLDKLRTNGETGRELIRDIERVVERARPNSVRLADLLTKRRPRGLEQPSQDPDCLRVASSQRAESGLGGATPRE
jgi:hypothetical protein